MLATTTAPSTPPESTPVPDLGTAVEYGGTPKPGVPKEMNPPSIECSTNANTTSSMTMPNLQPPSPPPVTDSDGDITSHPPQEINAENAGGDRPPHLSHGSYDIV